MFDLSLFEDLPLERLDEEVVFSLDAMYGAQVIKGVHDLLKDASPFKMVAFVIVSLIPYFPNILLQPN